MKSMKIFYKAIFALTVLLPILTSCSDPDDVTTAESFVSINPKSTVITGFRGTSVQIELIVTSSGPLTELTANGNAITPPSAGSSQAFYTFEIPADGVAGTEYDIKLVAENALGSKESTVTVILVPGPGIEASSTVALASTLSDFSMIEIEALISSTDELDTYNTFGGFQLGGSADGMGMVENTDGNFELLVNCEDHYSVARITLGGDLKPLKGDYLLNSSVSDYARQCSGTMWEKEIHGGGMDLYISSSESFNYISRGINPYIIEPKPSDNAHLTALGQFSWENNVPLPQSAYNGSTVIVGGDDDSSNSEGQIALYYSESGDMDLSGGDIYVLKRAGATSVETEGDLDFGVTYDVEFVKIPNGASLSKDEMEQASIDALSLQFMRVEDLDYGKGSSEAGRTVYFAVTGRGPGRGTYNDWGTGYKLELDDSSPLTGKLTQVVSGNTDTNKMDGNMSLLQSPDNIVVTENYIYWQEDPNSFNRNHQAYIWQTDLNGNNPKAVLQIDLEQSLNFEGDAFSGEFGAMIDISDKVGEEGTFLLALQPHYWTEDKYAGIDGHDLGDAPAYGREDRQGSQIVILRNVPR